MWLELAKQAASLAETNAPCGFATRGQIEMRRETDVIGRARCATLLTLLSISHRAAEMDRAGRTAEESLPSTPGQKKEMTR